MAVEHFFAPFVHLEGNAMFSLLVFVCILLISFWAIRAARLPPGPFGLPYLGYGPFLGEYYH